MSTTLKAPKTASGIDWVARASELAPMIEAAADRTEAEGQVPTDVMEALHEAELFRMLLPRSMGCSEADPLTMMRVLEIVAGADASTAWCLGQALGCSYAAAYTAPEVACDIFGPRNAVLAWGPPGPSKAIPVDGGYRVTGRWRFASGSRHATWLGGHTRVCDADGNPVSNPGGSPKLRTMLFKKSDVKMIDVWQVIGLRGTGSDDYTVEDLFVPQAYTTWREDEEDLREDGPLYRIPLLTCYGMGFSALTLGIARSMMNSFKELARNKTTGASGGSKAVLADNAAVQSQVAEAEAKILSSRCFLYDTAAEYWDVLSAGDEPSYDLRARLRLSITYAMNQAREAATYAYHAAGTNAIFEKNPFERRFRDIYTVSQQGQGHKANYEPVGQVFMGQKPDGHRV